MEDCTRVVGQTVASNSQSAARADSCQGRLGGVPRMVITAGAVMLPHKHQLLVCSETFQGLILSRTAGVQREGILPLVLMAVSSLAASRSASKSRAGTTVGWVGSQDWWVRRNEGVKLTSSWNKRHAVWPVHSRRERIKVYPDVEGQLPQKLWYHGHSECPVKEKKHFTILTSPCNPTTDFSEVNGGGSCLLCLRISSLQQFWERLYHSVQNSLSGRTRRCSLFKNKNLMFWPSM